MANKTLQRIKVSKPMVLASLNACLLVSLALGKLHLFLHVYFSSVSVLLYGGFYQVMRMGDSDDSDDSSPLQTVQRIQRNFHNRKVRPAHLC